MRGKRYIARIFTQIIIWIDVMMIFFLTYMPFDNYLFQNDNPNCPIIMLRKISLIFCLSKIIQYAVIHSSAGENKIFIGCLIIWSTLISFIYFFSLFGSQHLLIWTKKIYFFCCHIIRFRTCLTLSSFDWQSVFWMHPFLLLLFL